tara:strand:+ start:196 stop:414 length:219 start_codon:yes stop_codon:yes gene_type:complete
MGAMESRKEPCKVKAMSIFTTMEFVDFYYYAMSGDSKVFMQQTIDLSESFDMMDERVEFISNEIDLRSTILN